MTTPGVLEETVAAPGPLTVLVRDCAARLLLDQLADTWTVLVIGVLDEGPARFNALRRRVDGVTQKVLTQTLRRLERNGLVDRTVATSGPLAVEYRLTDLGRTLYAPMRALCDWTGEHLPAVTSAQAAYDAASSRSGSPAAPSA